jgi:hypothetical protein
MTLILLAVSIPSAGAVEMIRFIADVLDCSYRNLFQKVMGLEPGDYRNLQPLLSPMRPVP